VARVEQVRRIRDPFADLAVSPPPATLTVAQTRAVALIDAVEPGGGALLFGVTGSGKTLVYLEAIRRQVAAGHGAIILVPEIGLTPQTVSRVRGVFGDQVAVLQRPVGRRAGGRVVQSAPGAVPGGGGCPLGGVCSGAGFGRHRDR